MTEMTKSGDGFNSFSMLRLDKQGRFIHPDAPNRPIDPNGLPNFLKRAIVLPAGVTDVFVWVHGWQNDETRAVGTARRLFANLEDWFIQRGPAYPKLKKIVPGFVAVNWPSRSTPGLIGYKKIRSRARRMTTEGEAEFFLASLLGYLETRNSRSPARKVLRAKAGFYVHCIGHSFGGRFLTAAIKAAGSPSAPTRKLLAAARRETGFEFAVDSLCVLQMAAPAKDFATELSALIETGPLIGPIVFTYSSKDSALCVWHRVGELQVGIGCNGAVEPADRIGRTDFRPANRPYTDRDFENDITNVDASRIFVKSGLAEGAHSDFWHEETLHLIASLTEQTR